MNISTDTDPMSHEEAVRSNTVERFVLDEITPEDRERFKAHFFDCDECFEGVRLTSEFLRHTQRVLTPETEKGPVARFLTDLWNPAPRFVTALLLIAFGTSVYQQRLIADLKKPRQEARVYLSELTRSKGNEKVISVPRHSRLALESGFLQRDEFKSYRALILTEPDKRTTYTVPLHLEEDEVSITIGLPPEALPEGIYSLAIQGQQSDGQWKTLEEGKKEAGGIFRISVNTLKEPSWKAALGNGGPELRLKRNMT